MTTRRIALAQLAYPASATDSIARVRAAIRAAGDAHADLVCFPEGYVPGYRGLGYEPPPPDAAVVDRAWKEIADAARAASVAVVLGTERILDGALVMTAIVIDAAGQVLGYQDKAQVDPSEDGIYTPSPSTARHVFTTRGLSFGVVICHEGWRYPETVRAAAQRGAQIIFHPHLSVAEPGAVAPTTFADPASSFHDKAMLCRAAENTCYFASVNYAVPDAPTTSAIVRPDGTVQAWQPYGVDGLLVADIDLAAATGLLAKRYRGVT
jgi:predicted amidohydrolase